MTVKIIQAAHAIKNDNNGEERERERQRDRRGVIERKDTFSFYLTLAKKICFNCTLN